ncbi:hypothetical protein AX16_010280 [Volvariella volvacea WC 439]|nr:hypothetical protein AX16_010280 [Volvariella volvacea WC 439]
MNFKAPSIYSIDANVTLAIELISIDPVARIIVMDWYPTAPNAITCSPGSDFVADIYLDPALIDNSTPEFSILPPYSPTCRFNITELCQGTVRLAAFRTTSKLVASPYRPGHHMQACKTTLSMCTLKSLQNQMEPNAETWVRIRYYAQFILFASNPENDERIHLNVTHTFGVAVNFGVTLHAARASLPLEDERWLHIILRVERSTATKTFVILVIVTQWFTALIFTTITVATFKYRSHKLYFEVFVLPIASLFAFTTIRESFPGAPDGFGDPLDLYSIIPVLILMSICSFSLVLRVLRLRISEGGNEETISRLIQLPPGANSVGIDLGSSQVTHMDERATIVGIAVTIRRNTRSPYRNLEQAPCNALTALEQNA